MAESDLIETCPICKNKTLVTTIKENDIPYFGRTLIYTSICSSCGYKHSDVIFLEQKRPVRIEFKASGPEDLKVRVIRSSRASISIPELGVGIEPVQDGESFISDIEGVLFRVLNVMSQVLKDSSPKERKIIIEKMKKIGKMRNGLDVLTFIIEDPSGNSAIISNRAKIEFKQ
ncbi:MAG: ZPR1 zinc finger domain-containing protein [Thermoplasmata archaeon]